MNWPAQLPPGGVPLRIATDHPALAGHFPGQPIVPGVVLLDEVLHAIGGERGDTACWRLGAVKFHRIVPAGQPLRLQYRALDGGRISFELCADDGVIVSGTVCMAPGVADAGSAQASPVEPGPAGAAAGSAS